MSRKSLKLLKNRQDRFCPCKLLCLGAGAAAIAVTAGSVISRIARRTPEEKKQPDKPDDSLLQAVSQDLKTPLMDIMGSSLLFLENYDSLDEEERIQIVRQIHEGSGWLINMAENLSAITHIRGGAPALSIREEIVEEVLGEALQKIEKRHPERLIRVKIPEDFILLPMDADLIEQAVINLVENAMLHSDSTKPVDIIVEEADDSVFFTVRDYGDGIPKNLAEHLFDTAFSSLHTSYFREGTNIGLLICKTILSAHHGSITGRNHDHGAEFVFALPKRTGAPSDEY